MTFVFYVAIWAVAATVSGLMIPYVHRLSVRNGWFDLPGGRKQHPEPIPRLGGVAIFTSFVLVVGGGFVFAPAFASLELVETLLPKMSRVLSQAHEVRSQMVGLLIGGTIVFIIGVLDDVLRESFPLKIKFAGQCLAAAIAVSCGIQIEFAGVQSVNWLLSFLWILGISNSFNLMDNTDGLAAGVAVMSGYIFLLNAIVLNEIFITLVLLALIGSACGFLRYNWPPARIFMGDGGALFIGFVLSSLTILEAYVRPYGSSLFPVLMPPLVLAVPLIDTVSVIFIRVRAGKPVYHGDRNHLSHRLVRSGFTPTQAILLLFTLTLSLGMGALNIVHAPLSQYFWTVIHAGIVAAVLLVGMRANLENKPDESKESLAPRHSPNAVESL